MLEGIFGGEVLGLSLTSTFRQFFTVFLCWVLLGSHLSVTAAYAQDIEDVNITEHWREKKTRVHDTSVVNAVALLIGGFVAGSMLKCKRIPPSGKIFIAGMVIYLLGEITTVGKLKERIRREIILYESTRAIDASQRQALLSMVRGYNQYIKAIKQRMGFLLGAFIALQIAAVLAFTEARVQEVTRDQALQAAGQCFNGAPAEAATNPTVAPQCLQCQQSAGQAISALNNEPPEEENEEEEEEQEEQQEGEEQQQEGQQDQGQQSADQQGQVDQSAQPAAQPSTDAPTAPTSPSAPVENIPAPTSPSAPAPTNPNLDSPAAKGFFDGDRVTNKTKILKSKEMQSVMKLATNLFKLKPIEFETKFAGPISNLRLAPQ